MSEGSKVFDTGQKNQPWQRKNHQHEFRTIILLSREKYGIMLNSIIKVNRAHTSKALTLCVRKKSMGRHTKKRESKQVIIIAVLVLQFFNRWLFDWFAQAVVVHCLVYAWWYNPTPILGFTKLKFLFLLCVYKGGTMILCIPIPL